MIFSICEKTDPPILTVIPWKVHSEFKRAEENSGGKIQRPTEFDPLAKRGFEV
jgi:hypothetical protein